jgi:glycosyltransferase involved in cell wall biosynthesis
VSRQSLKTIANGLWRYATALPNLALLTRVFRSQHLDIIHINNGGYPAAETCRLAALAASQAKIRVRVMTIHSPAASPSWPRPLERRLDNKVVKELQSIVAMSASTRRSLQEARGMPAHKLRMMNLGITLAPLNVADLARDVVRSQFGIPASGILLGMVGRFDWYKGHRTLLKATRQVMDSGQGSDLYVLLVGEGDELSSVKALAESLGLNRRVAFTGFYPAVLDAIQACDVMAMLSIGYEGQGYVLLEAMSQAKPVIATRVGGQVEVVVDGKTGILVPPSDSTALAGAVCRLLGDRQLREAMGKEGRGRVESFFGLERMLTETQALYEILLSG